MQFLGQFMQSASGPSVLSAGNGSGVIPKLSVKRGLDCSLRENELVSTLLTLWENAVRFLNKRNAVQHTLAALLVHS